MQISTAGVWNARYVALGVLFGVLVTANSAGYRYGISDQAFYIPAVDLARNPALFPRDRDVLEPQARFTVMDEGLAAVSEGTNLELEPLFFAGYLLTIVLFVAGVRLIGGRLYTSAVGVTALTIALTLRHRIARTGVNTFEGYFHPRVLAFSVGLIAVGALWRGHRRLAIGMSVVACLIHPTTGAWFVVWIAVAWLAIVRPFGRVGIASVVSAAAAVLLLGCGPLDSWLVGMDPSWRSVLSGRDYLFPTSDWGPTTWLMNLAGAVMVMVGLEWRTRLGLAGATERGVVIGALALLGLFLVSLPWVATYVAFAVQLQTSRMLWTLDLLGTAYLVWILIEAPMPGPPTRRRAAIVLAVLIAASAGRGYYVLRVEHANPLVAVWPDPSHWQRLGRWIRINTPVDAHLLADPVHVWPYGSSLRVVADRDVLTEHVKDTAIAIYGRDVAMRVRERRRAIGDFHRLTEEDARLLARQYDLDYLVADRTLRLPVVHREGPLRLYSLDQPAGTAEKAGRQSRRTVNRSGDGS